MKSLKESLLDVDDNINDRSLEVEAWLKANCRTRKDNGKFEIIYNNDDTVDIIGSVFLENGVDLPTDFKFNKITGGLSVSNLDIIDLKGFPKYVGSLQLFNCPKFKSFKGDVVEVGGVEIHSAPELKSLANLPKVTNPKNKKISFDNIGIKDLTTLPNNYDVDKISLLYCDNLISIKGCPKTVKEINLNYSKNIEDISDYPKGIKRFQMPGCNKITKLHGLDKQLKDNRGDMWIDYIMILDEKITDWILDPMQERGTVRH